MCVCACVCFHRQHASKFTVYRDYSCSMLQCVAVCCNVLQCDDDSVLQCVSNALYNATMIAVWRSVLQCVAMCCNVLQCDDCSVLQCVTNV